MRFAPKQIALLCLAFIILGIGCVSAFLSWRTYVMQNQEKQAYLSAKTYLDQSRGVEALRIIKAIKTSPVYQIDTWLPLEIKAMEQTRNLHRLLYLYEQYPDVVLQQEKASSLIARTLLEMKNMEIYQRVRGAWLENSKKPELWFALDVDALLLQNKRQEAKTLLKKQSFEGAADCGRLIRLALLEGGQNIDKAWQYLDEAYRKDPRNPDVRSFRAQILESQGNIRMARMEYVAAYLSNPKNMLFRDQLAEFYRRQGNYGQALQTWVGGLSPPSLDYLWIKTLFWSKVSHPVNIPNDFLAQAPLGEMLPLVKVIQSCPPDKFWNTEHISQEVTINTYADKRQEIFWLKLLQALQDGSEGKAMEILRSKHFKQPSYNPQLERALQIILVYRRWGVLMEPDMCLLSAPPKTKVYKHQFFELLDKLLEKKKCEVLKMEEIPADLERFLKSKDVFSAAFMAGGWLEAAIKLQKNTTIPESYPSWYAYGMTQAIRYNRGSSQALDFAQRQKQTPSLDCLMAEIMLSDNQIEEAVGKLQQLARTDSDFGFRAAWLLSIEYLHKQDYTQAAQSVRENPRLKNSVAGKEILAKIALGQNNPEDAMRIYTDIKDTSLEAKAYLARRAFASKDWQTARKYTEELIGYFPDMLELRANLKRIQEAEKHGQA